MERYTCTRILRGNLSIYNVPSFCIDNKYMELICFVMFCFILPFKNSISPIVKDVSSIGAGLAQMTSKNGDQDGRHGSKMAARTPRWPPWLRPSPDKGHDL